MIDGAQGCFATGCTREQLFDQECDEGCDSDICHSDNWRCFTHDEVRPQHCICSLADFLRAIG